MAIRDPDTPEDLGRRIGGNSPTIGRKRPRPVGDRARIAGTLPAEYAEFRLEDGRTFGEVMGAGFFGPPSGADGGEPMPPDLHERLRDGNYPLARMVRENPDRFAPPRGDLKSRATGLPPGQEEAGLPAQGGDNEADFTNLPFGPEEGDEADSTTDFPIAKPWPQGIGAGAPGQSTKREFTPDDILDLRERQEFENLTIETESVKTQKANHRKNLAFKEQQFDAGDIGANAIGRARSNFTGEIDKLDKQIEGNEMRIAEIRVDADLDAAKLVLRDTPGVEGAREEAEETRRRRGSRHQLAGRNNGRNRGTAKPPAVGTRGAGGCSQTSRFSGRFQSSGGNGMRQGMILRNLKAKAMAFPDTC